MKDLKYSDDDLKSIIVELTELFETAKQTYRLALSERTSNRSKKELMRGNSKGTTINKYECDFAWILYDIQCGPICFIEDKIQEAHDLIIHLKNISEV